MVQQILRFNDPRFNLRICEFVCADFVHYCLQKISSNVVEQAVRLSSLECKKFVFNYLLKNGAALQEIMLDQYGNYVAQAVFQKSYDLQDQTYFNCFYEVFNKSLEDLKRVSFGKKLIQKICD